MPYIGIHPSGVTLDGYKTDLMFCITTDETTACGSGVQVNAGGSSTVSASDLGDPSNMYLNVTNLSPDTEGSYKVTIV